MTLGRADRRRRRRPRSAGRPDPVRERIAAYRFPGGGVEVVRANRGYTLSSRRTGGPVARLGDGDRVQVAWWRRDAWGAPGDFGPVVMPLDEALAFIAAEGVFWVPACRPPPSEPCRAKLPTGPETDVSGQGRHI